MRYERSPARPTTPPRHRLTTPGADDTFPERAAARLRTAVVAAAFLGFGCFLYRADVGTLIPDWAWGGPESACSRAVVELRVGWRVPISIIWCRFSAPSPSDTRSCVVLMTGSRAGMV
jgi:hypothetical protein